MEVTVVKKNVTKFDTIKIGGTFKMVDGNGYFMKTQECYVCCGYEEYETANFVNVVTGILGWCSPDVDVIRVDSKIVIKE